jgi:hypothetical protein
MSVEEITEKVIARDVRRGGKFLRALGTRPAIRGALATRGYTESEHQRLWGLLLTLMGYNPASAPTEGSNESLASLSFLDNADGPLLRAFQAVLEARYPDQYQYATAGLTASEGLKAVGVVQQLVDRTAAMRDGTDPARASKRDEDKKAAEVLAARGVLSPAMHETYRAHLAKAKAIAPEITATPTTEAQKKYQDAGREFHISLREWRELARQTITRRDYLISLGLAERRRAKVGAETESEEDDDGSMD